MPQLTQDIQIPECNGYRQYVSLRDSMLKSGRLVGIRNIKDITHIVSEGFPVVILPHYDPDARKIEGMNEIYIRDLHK